MIKFMSLADEEEEKLNRLFKVKGWALKHYFKLQEEEIEALHQGKNIRYVAIENFEDGTSTGKYLEQ